MKKIAFIGHPTETLFCAPVPPEKNFMTGMVFRANYIGTESGLHQIDFFSSIFTFR